MFFVLQLLAFSPYTLSLEGEDDNLLNTHLFSSKSKLIGYSTDANIDLSKRVRVVCFGMLAPRKFLQRKKKVEEFEDGADKADQRNWRKLMAEIDESGSAVSVLQSRRAGSQSLPKDLVVGTLVRFKQLKKWNIVSEVAVSLFIF